ncbi:MAG: ABC transporter ATP-binding protein, partial [Solirubrobacteraceae bacterium]
VFLSSHLMAEMAQTAEHLVVIGRGRMIADTTVAEIVAQASHDAAVLVRTPQASELRELLVGEGVSVSSTERELLEVHGLTSAQVGTTAAEHRIVLHELISQQASLEEAFMRLTGGAVEYHAGTLDTDVIDSIQEAA